MNGRSVGCSCFPTWTTRWVSAVVYVHKRAVLWFLYSGKKDYSDNWC